MDPSISEYLERLNGLLDVYTNAVESHTMKVDALVVSWATSTPAVVHNPPSLTPSPESTTDASAPVPDVSGSTTKAQEVLEVIHDAPPACIAMAHVTCSTECSHRDATAAIFLEPAVDLNDNEVEQLAPARPTPSISTGTFSITEEVIPSGASTTDIDPKDDVQELDALPLFSINTSTLVTNEVSAIKLMQLFVDHDLDLPPTRHHGLRIRPMPWPSLWRDIADGSEVRPIPWPSFPVKKFMEHPFQFVQLLVMGLTSSTFPMESCHVGDLVGNHSGHCIRIISVELLCLWSLQQNSVGSCPSKHAKLFSYNKQWPSELGTCTIILALEMRHSGLAPMAAHQFRSVKKHSAWNTASSFGFQLIQCEPVLSSDIANINEQG